MCITTPSLLARAGRWLIELGLGIHGGPEPDLGI